MALLTADASPRFGVVIKAEEHETSYEARQRWSSN